MLAWFESEFVKKFSIERKIWIKFYSKVFLE